ncbi:formylglycine-generating enzyme family protein [Planomicrobium sp. Y74]|uniref:formylglycine-generating enzyme family protein n=1 Tax=Planomicrobium sp. Y74 TaxID=2478977 RepID=UPI000EF4D99A|nr:formylglycine-generating enzyme family protein [Planomicrobium sp. Y74]RLQ91220.1 formylglycine-generating enzyme family protein [Planomicrobium sp. Y74]
MEREQTNCCSASRQDLSATKKSIEKDEIPSVQQEKKIRFPEKMVRIDGGTFLMGTDDEEGFQADREGPVREQHSKPFLMDSYTVTNREFTQFVKETGYITEAERFGWSFVFFRFIARDIQVEVRQVAATPWWFAVEQAYWHQPEGPGSSIKDRMDHPVIHVSWNDAEAFAGWAGKRLPSESEWEFAARGGLVQQKYPWGDELTPNGEHYCNIWQGAFPNTNTKEDGYIGTAPAVSFPENGFGLYNMAGNVWEWCSDPFAQQTEEESHQENIRRAMRGGSYLCHESYCNRYRVTARTSNTMESSAGNIGFRCAADIEMEGSI